MAYATTSKGRESTSSTVARAKKMLSSSLKKTGGSVKTGNTSKSRLAEIASQDFVTDKNKRDLVSSGAINADSIGNVEQVSLPGEVVSPYPTNGIEFNNSGLGDTDNKGLFNFTASDGAGAGETAATNSMNSLGSQLGDYLGIARPEEGANENAIEDARRQAGVEAAQQEYNKYQNQINTITTKRDADQLGLEGQGRGITDTIIGGQQARIGREAAIQALPIQAQLAAAQGNLEQAKELMGQLYQAKSADIAADLSYRQNLSNSLMSFATTAQQTILQGLNADNAQKAATAQANLAYQRQLGLQALEYGQNGLINGISSIDPNSPTFEQDIAAFTSQLRKPVVAKDLDTSFDKFGNLINMQTGEVIRMADDVTDSDKELTVEQRDIIASELSTKIDTIEALKTHEGMTATVGVYGLGRTTPFTVDKAEQRDFVSSVEQMISQEFLDELIAVKAKGGAFGALAKPEQDALTAAATKLGQLRVWKGEGEDRKVVGYEISEADFIKELDVIIKTAQAAESRARGYDVTMVGADDSETIDNLFTAYQAENFNVANLYE